MADYGAMSDADLLALIQPKAAAPKQDYSGLSDADLLAKVQGAKAPITAEGLYKAADAGVAKGTAALLGAPGDLTALGAKGIGAASDWINDKLGLPKYEQPSTPGPISSFLQKYLPNSESMGREIQNRYYGGAKPYEPQNTGERYAERIGEMAPGMVGPGGIISKGISAAGAGAGSVAVEDLAAKNFGEGARPYGSVVGAVAGGMSPSALARALTPIPASPARTRLVGVLNDEGVTSLTAGQRTGNKALQYAESILGDGPLAGQGASRVQQQGQQQFTEAAMRRAGPGLADATPETLAANNTRLGNQFEELSARNALTPDNQFINDITRAVRDYRNVPNSQQAAMLQGYIDDIVPHVNAGTMTGAEYQAMRSRLSRQANNNRLNDPDLADALRGIRNALDDAMGRSIPVGSQDHALWNESRRQWGAQKTIENTASKAGEAMTEGQISPTALRNTVSAANRGAYARGQGDFSELARAGAGVMAPLPNSGTAQRNLLTNLAVLPVTATAGRAIMNPVVQSYLGNQLISGARREGLPTTAQALARALLSQDRAPLLNGPSR